MAVATGVDALTYQVDRILRELGSELSPEQYAVLLCADREILASGGERAGKSYVGAKYYTVRFPYCDLVWIAGKDYERCHSEFEYIAQDMLKLGVVRSDSIHTPKNGQWDMTLNLPQSNYPDRKVLIKTWSLQDWLKVGSEAPDMIIGCEIAQITLPEYRRLCDRTAEKRGTVIGTGTFEGSLGWYPEMWKLYQLPGQMGKSFSLPSWSNRVIYPGGINDPEIIRLKNKYPADYFNERFGAVPAPPKGIVFPEFRYLTHVRELTVEDKPIELWIDPGYAGAYAVEVVQIINDVVRIVDEVYMQAYTEDVMTVCMQKPWWKLVHGGVIDVAARQHQGGVVPIAEQWLKGPAHLYLSSMKVEEAAGRDTMHTFLKVNPIEHEPKVLVDPKCKGLLSEFGVCPNPFTEEAAPYSWKMNQVGQTQGQHPEDKNNHGIKAMIYGLVQKFGYSGKGGGKPITTHSKRRR
jgi:hypothetical protein